MRAARVGARVGRARVVVGDGAAGMKRMSSMRSSTVQAPLDELTCHCSPTSCAGAGMTDAENDENGTLTSVGIVVSVLGSGRFDRRR